MTAAAGNHHSGARDRQIAAAGGCSRPTRRRATVTAVDLAAGQAATACGTASGSGGAGCPAVAGGFAVGIELAQIPIADGTSYRFQSLPAPANGCESPTGHALRAHGAELTSQPGRVRCCSAIGARTRRE